MRPLLLSFLVFFMPTSWADEMLGELDLSKGNALQMQLCSLKPGKSMKAYEAMFDDYLEWAVENDQESWALRLTPVFAAPGPNASFEWIEIMASPFEKWGAGWDKWLGTKEGSRLNDQWQELADCRVAVHQMFNLYIDRDGLADDSRVITMDWCTRNEGVTYDQLNERHRAAAANMDDSPVVAWNIIYPGVGARNVPGEFLHMMSYKNHQGLMLSRDAFANAGGWQRREAYETSYATCTGTNVYQAKVLQVPGS